MGTVLAPKLAMVDLSIGGEDWCGWRLSRYGRCKDARLIAPTGEVFCAGEIVESRALLHDLDYLQQRVKLLETMLSKTAVHLSESELLTLQAAAEILQSLNKKPRLRSRWQASCIPLTRS